MIRHDDDEDDGGGGDGDGDDESVLVGSLSRAQIDR